MKVRIEFVPENSTEESVLHFLADNEDSMDEISSVLTNALYKYFNPAFEAWLGPTGFVRWLLSNKNFSHYRRWQPKVEVTYVRITERGDTT